MFVTTGNGVAKFVIKSPCHVDLQEQGDGHVLEESKFTLGLKYRFSLTRAPTVVS